MRLTRYALDVEASPFPFTLENYMGTITVVDGPDNQSVILWASHYRCSDCAALDAMLTEMINGSFASIEVRLSSADPSTPSCRSIL